MRSLHSSNLRVDFTLFHETNKGCTGEPLLGGFFLIGYIGRKFVAEKRLQRFGTDQMMDCDDETEHRSGLGPSRSCKAGLVFAAFVAHTSAPELDCQAPHFCQGPVGLYRVKFCLRSHDGKQTLERGKRIRFL